MEGNDIIRPILLLRRLRKVRRRPSGQVGGMTEIILRKSWGEADIRGQGDGHLTPLIWTDFLGDFKALWNFSAQPSPSPTGIIFVQNTSDLQLMIFGGYHSHQMAYFCWCSLFFPWKFLFIFKLNKIWLLSPKELTFQTPDLSRILVWVWVWFISLIKGLSSK